MLFYIRVEEGEEADKFGNAPTDDVEGIPRKIDESLQKSNTSFAWAAVWPRLGHRGPTLLVLKNDLYFATNGKTFSRRNVATCGRPQVLLVAAEEPAEAGTMPFFWGRRRRIVYTEIPTPP
jgi:hypothetical protein